MYEIVNPDHQKTLEQMQHEVLEITTDNGWYATDRRVGEDIALLHSEVSEMLEAYRDHGLEDATDYPATYGDPGRVPKPEGFGAEAADVFIRLLDTCERHGVDLRAEYERKCAYNRTRGYRHGGKNL